MDQSTTVTKIQSFIEKELHNQLPELIDQCKSWEILSFEDQSWQIILGLYNFTAKLVLGQEGLRKLEVRPVEVQIRTGHYVKVSAYMPAKYLWVIEVSGSYSMPIGNY